MLKQGLSFRLSRMTEGEKSSGVEIGRHLEYYFRHQCRGVSKTQTSKTQSSDPKNSDPLGVSKTQTLRKLDNFERFHKP